MNIGIFFLFANSAHATHSNFDLLNLSERVSGLADAYLKISLEQAWGKINTPPQSLTTVVIGIFDSGTDTTHPEFTGVRLGTTPPDAKIDSDPDGHGTEVAGIIGANNVSFPISTNYQFPQMNGVLSGAHNLNYRLEIRKSEQFTFFDTLKSVNELTDSSVQIINLSISSFRITSFAHDTFFSLKFLANPNVLFILAAGNEDRNAEFNTPANWGDNFGNVLTVGATRLDDSRVPMSNFGSAVSLAAPGDRVYAPRPLRSPLPLDAGDYDPNFSDTSAAAPLVTGVAGLIKAIKPSLTPSEIKAVLIRSADPITTTLPSELVKTLGSGCATGTPPLGFRGCRLNALRAVCDPQVLSCGAPPPFVLHAAGVVQLLTDNISSGEIKANDFVGFSTNNLHRGNVTANTLISFGTNNRIEGDVGYNSLLLYFSYSTPPVITGTITIPTPPLTVILPDIPPFPLATTTMIISSDATLQPGNNGNLFVTNGATITLLDGVYNFDTFILLDSNTSLRFSVGTILNLNGFISAGANIRILPITAGSSARLPITAGGFIAFATGNSVAADLRTRGAVILFSGNTFNGNIQGNDIVAFDRNRINAPPLPSSLSLRGLSLTSPTSTTTPLDTLNWMEENTMSALVHANIATTTRTQIKGEFQKARAVLKNN